MFINERERSAAQAHLERLTEELVRLFEQREALKQALDDSSFGSHAANAEGAACAEGVMPDVTWPVVGILHGARQGSIPADDPSRRALRARLRVIHGGLK
ncbi:MAG: hypothetical protein HY332_09310 [Chloroflexi bacterium]|nr:hypothetical protein [Chloroflexota bacterium]